MRLRRAVAIEGLNRPRLDEAGARLALYPTSHRKCVLGVFALGGGAYIKSGPEREAPGRIPTRKGDSQ